MSYYVVNDFEHETVIKRSRFLTVLKKLETEQDALDALAELKSRYRDCSHLCYAYRVGERAERTRFSDAGEPSGTAGMPILQALIEAEATFSLAAVVRWFGGVKLGAGGLTRAYHSCAADAIALGGRRRYELCDVLEVGCDLSLYGLVVRVAESRGAVVTARDFADKVTLTLAVKDAATSVIKAITDACCGNASVKECGSHYLEI